MSTPQRPNQLSRWEGVDLSRRRHQRGYLRKHGTSWLLTWYEDALDSEGNLKRTRRNDNLGPFSRIGAKEARREADGIMAVVNRAARRPGSLVSVKQFVELYFLPEHVATLSHASQLHYRYILGHVVPAIGELRLRNVDFGHIQGLVTERAAAGYSPQTVHHIRNAVSALFTHAERRGWMVGPNWARRVRLAPLRRVQGRHALTDEQATVVITTLPSPSREMGALSIGTSLGPSEMLALRWRRLNLTDLPVYMDGETLRSWHLLVAESFYRGAMGGPKATARHRQVPIPASLADLLLEYRRHAKFTGPDDFVFANSRGGPCSETNLNKRQLKPTARALGLPWLSWRVFRRTATTLAEAHGLPLSDRMAMMGHSRAAMTMHYRMADPERHRAGMESIMGVILRLAAKSSAVPSGAGMDPGGIGLAGDVRSCVAGDAHRET